MRQCRFGGDRLGLVRQGHVVDVTGICDRLPNFRYPLPKFDPFIAELDSLREPIREVAEDQPGIPIGEVKFGAPVANPGKIIGAPVNYRRHLQEAREDPEIHHSNQIAEIERVGLFLKAPSSVIGPSEAIMIRHPERRTDHEIELAVVIGKRADRVPPHRAFEYVAGYCIGLDITVRGPEERSLRKSIDTYTVLGPWLVTTDELADPSQLSLKLWVNGEVKQDSNTSGMIFNLAEQIEEITAGTTLHPGDLIMTGTPAGVGAGRGEFLKAGDVVKLWIEKIGEIENRMT